MIYIRYTQNSIDRYQRQFPSIHSNLKHMVKTVDKLENSRIMPESITNDLKDTYQIVAGKIYLNVRKLI